MSDNVLDRLRQNRQRTTVPPRNDTLIARAQPAEPPTTPVPTPPAKVLTQATPAAMRPDPLAELRAELATIPSTHRHSAIVLDQDLDQQLTRYCKDHRITLEVFLEAAWVHAAAHPAALTEILTEAQRRYADRKRAGKLRRLITMLESPSQDE
jgi:hypothetical protein